MLGQVVSYENTEKGWGSISYIFFGIGEGIRVPRKQENEKTRKGKKKKKENNPNASIDSKNQEPRNI